VSNLIGNGFKGAFAVGSFLFKGKLLRQEEGARFSNRKETRKIFRSSNTGVLIDGVDKRLSAKDSFEHIAVIAKPGAGKTTSYIIPNILDRADRNNSILALDPSGELYEQTSGYLKSKGYKIHALNPGSPIESVRFNPFHGLDARNLVEIEQICASIVLTKYGNDREGVWNDGAIALLEVLAKCLAYGDSELLNLVNINYLLQLFGIDGKNLDDWVSDNSMNPYDPSDRTVIDAWKGITQSNERMLTSYSTIAKTALKQLNNRDIQSLLCDNDIDLNRFRKEKTALFIIVPSHQQEYYQFLIDVLYTRFFNVMMKKRPSSSDLDVYCFLDEFGSSYIKDFSAVVTNIRKYRVSLSIVLQTISQLDVKYGRGSEAIKGGIGSYLVFSGSDFNTSSEISQVIGRQQFTERNDYSDTVRNHREQNLLNPDQIRTLQDNELVFLSKNRFPIILETTPFFENSKLAKKSKVLMAEFQLNQNRVVNQLKF